jgi:hypothetical protein
MKSDAGSKNVIVHRDSGFSIELHRSTPELRDGLKSQTAFQGMQNALQFSRQNSQFHFSHLCLTFSTRD